MESMDVFGEAMYNNFVVDDSMRIPVIVQEGIEEKFFIEYKGVQYLVKDSSMRRGKQTLSPYCEYTASNFIYYSGLLKCQKCYLGTYKNRTVVICTNIFSEGCFRPYEDLHQSSAGTELQNKVYTYDDVIYVLSQKAKQEHLDIPAYLHRFWLMFLFDALLGNRDRHAGNWGFYKNNGITEFAPIFDNGGSLFPDVDLSRRADYDYLKFGVTKGPASQFRAVRPEYENRLMRTNFIETLKQYKTYLCEELKQIQQLNIETLLDKSLQDVPEEIANWFYVLIKMRYQVIILGEEFDKVYNDFKRGVL